MLQRIGSIGFGIGLLGVLLCGPGGCSDDTAATDDRYPLERYALPTVEGKSVAVRDAESRWQGWRCDPVNPDDEVWYGCMVDLHLGCGGVACPEKTCIPPTGRVRRVEQGTLLQLGGHCAGLVTFEDGRQLEPNHIFWQLELLLPDAALTPGGWQVLRETEGASWKVHSLDFAMMFANAEDCPLPPYHQHDLAGETLDCPANALLTYSGQGGMAFDLDFRMAIYEFGMAEGDHVTLEFGRWIGGVMDPGPWVAQGEPVALCHDFGESLQLDNVVGKRGALLPRSAQLFGLSGSAQSGPLTARYACPYRGGAP